MIFGFNIVIAVGLLVGGGALVYANQRLDNRKVVTIKPSGKTDSGPVSADQLNNIPEGDLSTKNFLITGRDNNACFHIGKNSR